jgi:uncharacterized protein YeaO (DUF488 family)
MDKFKPRLNEEQARYHLFIETYKQVLERKECQEKIEQLRDMLNQKKRLVLVDST